MVDLKNTYCEPCRVGAPKLTNEELEAASIELPDWQVLDIADVKRLQRVFTFSNFVEAQAFTNSVAEIAEKDGHHPAILLEWGKVTVSWWTHKIGGLHHNDVLMAHKTNALEST